MLEGIYHTSCDNQPAMRRMNFVNAELTKIAVNTYVTTKISYANMLADLCDRLPDADVDVVTKAVGSDSRVGSKYLRGATGYGGPCFPRDNVAFAALARQIGARAELAEATDSINQYQLDRVLDIIAAHHQGSGAIAVLGLSYKPDTAVIERSQGVALVDRLCAQGRRVLAYDPKALDATRAAVRHTFETPGSATDCVRQASLVVIMTPWPEFAQIPIDAFARTGQRVTVVDCWRMIPEAVSAVATLVHPGRGAMSGAVPAGHSSNLLA